MAEGPKTIWVVSNRQDDRTVLWEQDPQHPSGEAFVGGAGPDFVARTPLIEAKLRSGEIIEIPEPPDGPKKPISVPPGYQDRPLNLPGQRIQLGRELDPELLANDKAVAQVAKAQDAAPNAIEVPSGVIIPPAETVKS